MRKRITLGFLFFCLITFPSVYSQSKVEFASPMVDVFSTDLGASSGDLEINYSTRIKENHSAILFNQELEIEFTPVKGFGLEIAWLNQPNIDKRLSAKQDFFEVTGQYSRVFDEKLAIATGLGFEKSVAVRPLKDADNSYSFRPFLRGAAIFKEKTHLQGGISTEIEKGEQLEFKPRYSTAAFYQWADLEVGVEVIGTLGNEHNLNITPQFAFSSGRLTIATGLQLPLLFEESLPSSSDLRLYLENGLTKRPFFMMRLTLSFEDEN